MSYFAEVKGMNIQDLEKINTDFKAFTQRMPTFIKNNYQIKRYHTGEVIHSKGEPLTYFGILIQGRTRVVNEFENGKVFMIETNPAIDYIGDVALLAQQPAASVTIEAATDSVVFAIPRLAAEKWLAVDATLLRRLAQRVANKLYTNSLDRGLRLLYPATFVFVNYLVKEGTQQHLTAGQTYKIPKTRPMISEEIGLNVKTLNRIIAKLKHQGFFEIDKGKLVLTAANVAAAQRYCAALKANG